MSEEDRVLPLKTCLHTMFAGLIMYYKLVNTTGIERANLTLHKNYPTHSLGTNISYSNLISRCRSCRYSNLT